MQEYVRRRFQKFIKESGMKQNFVADKLKISPVELCNFKKGRTDLADTAMMQLDEFMKKYHF